MTPLLVFAASVLVWALAAHRLARWSVIPPLVMVAAGLVSGGLLPNIARTESHSPIFQQGVQITLAVILFTDAADVSHRWLRRAAGIPIRLLGLALPLGVVLAFLSGRLLFDKTGAWLLAATAVLVMITDSAICEAVTSDPRVPITLRNSLKVESGFNDGLGGPFVLLFLSAAVAGSEHVDVEDAIGHIAREIAIGAAVGVALGWLASRAFAWSSDHTWSTDVSERIGIFMLPLLAYSVAIAIHGNGFTAAFVTALAASAVGRGLPERALQFTRGEGQLLSAAVWLTFGALARQTVAGGLSWSVIAYAVLVLTVARIVAVFISMLGAHLPHRHVWFLGWLGPRGLATVMFGLIAIGQLTGTDQRTFVAQIVTVTVGLSLVAHGVSSRWLPAFVQRGKRATV